MLAIGVDIGGTKIAGGVIDAAGDIVTTARRHTSARDAEAINAAIADLVGELVADHDVSAIGVAAAGFLDARRETMVVAPNVPAWRDYPLAAKVRAAIGADAPVIVENDANAAAFAEFTCGAARGAASMVMLTLGTGIGGGLILGGRIERGAHGFAGEPGHMNFIRDGRLCGCGRHGCWEQYASGTALTRDARRWARERPELAEDMLQRAGGDPDAIAGVDVTAAAVAGDSLATQLFAEQGRYLGEGCASIASLLDPEVIVIGGGVIAAGDLLMAPTREAFAHALPGAGGRPEPRIEPAQLGPEAGFIGAGLIALAECA